MNRNQRHNMRLAEALAPDTRRAVLAFACRENLTWADAIQFLILEGIKAQAGCPASCAVAGDSRGPMVVDGLGIRSWDGGKL